MGEFKMPSLGADMKAGTLLEWRVTPGQRVKRGDIVAVVDTSKAEIEVEIFEDGVIGKLLVPEGARVPVGTALATVLPEGEPAPAPPVPEPPPAPEPPPVPEPSPPPAPTQEAPPALRAPVPPPQAPAPAPHAPAPAPAHHVRASPVARRMAEDLGVDISLLRGSGPGGAIVQADVEKAGAGRAAQAPSPASTPPSPAPTPPSPASTPPSPAPTPPPAATRNAGEERTRHASSERQSAMRQAIGELMARSKREIPHYYLERHIDFSAAALWLQERNDKRPVGERLLPAALLLAATAKAAREMPEMNGFWVQDAFRPAEAVHLGVAVSLRGGGLVAPALRDADELSLDRLMAALSDLVARARTGVLRSSEMSDPTITVTNLGEQGADLVHGVIYAPQVALVGFGSVRERPWAQDGMLGVRKTVLATLAADHRASDGRTGSRFLAAIDRRLQRPEQL